VKENKGKKRDYKLKIKRLVIKKKRNKKDVVDTYI